MFEFHVQGCVFEFHVHWYEFEFQMGDLFAISCFHASFFTELVVLTSFMIYIAQSWIHQFLCTHSFGSFPLVCYSATSFELIDPSCSAIYGLQCFILYSAHANFKFAGSLVTCTNWASMASGSDDVAAEAASVTQYRTFSDVELLRKRRLEAEEATAARKVEQGRQLAENETRKRARIGETLCGWLTGARNARRLSLGGTDAATRNHYFS